MIMQSDIADARKDLRTWAKDKPQAVTLCCRNINGNLRILESNPSDDLALAALRKNFVVLKNALASDM